MTPPWSFVAICGKAVRLVEIARIGNRSTAENCELAHTEPQIALILSGDP